MKKVTTTLIALFLLFGLSVNAQNKKAKSPAQETVGKIGNTEITIKYCSPSLRGRVIFGELEPWDKVWRAGANEATTITFSKAVKINGSDIEAGTYAFFVKPSKDGNWTFIFNKESKQWGAYKHDPSKDALVGKSKVAKIDKAEVLTYSIEDNFIYLDWDTTRLGLKID